MPPNVSGSCLTTEIGEAEVNGKDAPSTKTNDDNSDLEVLTKQPERKLKWYEFKTDLIWFNVFYLSLLHLMALYCCCIYSYTENWKTNLWMYIVVLFAGIGVTGGAHRLWTHRCYKANLPLRVLLYCLHCTSGQNSVYDWVRDHRVHHKYTETDADPHNSNRGFFFAHVGWLMMKKHPEVIRRGRQIDMSDIIADPVVRYGDKFFPFLRFLFTFVIPSVVPVYGWNETWSRAIMSQAFIRYVAGLNGTWSVNSAAHLFGTKPYDKNINPSENKLVSFIAFGEGWHNYHHVFPWDYKAAELGNYSFNFTTCFIDFFAKIGWAYDLKEPSGDIVKNTTIRRGDGTHRVWGEISHPDIKNY